MSEEIKTPPDRSGIAIGGVRMSLRGFIALIIVFTVCTLSATGTKIEEPLYTLVGMVIGYYYAQDKKL